MNQLSPPLEAPEGGGEFEEVKNCSVKLKEALKANGKSVDDINEVHQLDPVHQTLVSA